MHGPSSECKLRHRLLWMYRGPRAILMKGNVLASQESRTMGDPVIVGDIIAGKYRVDRILGKGGMGMVVAATHLELLKVRAIKLMLPEATQVSMAAERFLREARAACELTSEHVAHVFDVGRLADDTPFMVMEH